MGTAPSATHRPPTLWQRVVARLGAPAILHIMRVYPPYLGAGIRPTHIDARFREIDVEMPLKPWNRNYVGTHFGGSLYAMCDPFFMLMVMENLGSGYVVWDKSATIDFLRPGRGRVCASFRITDAELDAIRDEVSRAGRAYPRFEVLVVDDSGEAVARIGKVLSVRPAGGKANG